MPAPSEAISDRADQRPRDRPATRQVVLEVMLLALGVLPLISVLSLVLASSSEFIGKFGDLEETIWQARNFWRVIEEGNANLTSSFFGAPTPYAHNPTELLQAPTVLVLYELTGDIFFTQNFVLLAFLFLNFCSMYIVLRLLNIGVGVSLLGAMVFLLAPATLMHGFAHAVLFATFPVPLYLYVLYRIKVQPEKVAGWAALGLLNALFFWVYEYFGLFGLMFTALFLLLNVSTTWKRRLIAQPAALLAAFLIVSSPVLALHISRARFDEAHDISLQRAVEDGYQFSASPANYLFPSDENFVYRELPTVFTHLDKSEHLNYLGIVNLASVFLWFYMLVAKREQLDAFLGRSPFLRALRWELLLGAALALVVSFGPLLKWNDSFLKLPVYLAYRFDLPVFNQLRSWGRFGIYAFAIVTVLAAHIFAYLFWRHRGLARFGPAVVAVALVVVIVDLYPLASIPRHKMEVPGAVSEIQSQQGDFFVLHLPLNISTGALHNSTAQLLQFFHGKRIVNGYSAFESPLFAQKVLDSPLVCLNYPQMVSLTPEERCATDAMGNFFLREDIRYIVYEKTTRYYIPGVFEPKDDMILRERTLQVLERLTGGNVFSKIYEDGGFTVFRRIAEATAGDQVLTIADRSLR